MKTWYSSKTSRLVSGILRNPLSSIFIQLLFFLFSHGILHWYLVYAKWTLLCEFCFKLGSCSKGNVQEIRHADQSFQPQIPQKLTWASQGVMKSCHSVNLGGATWALVYWEWHGVMGLWCLPPTHLHWWCHWRGPWKWSPLEKCCEELQEVVNPLGGSWCWTSLWGCVAPSPWHSFEHRCVLCLFLSVQGTAGHAAGDTSGSGIAENRVSASQKKPLLLLFLLLFFPLRLRRSQGASPPAVLWHCAAIKRWKPGSESSSDRLPGAGRPGPKSIVHTRKLSRVTWQVFKALENFTRKFSPFPAPFPRSAWIQVLSVYHFGN